MRRGLRQQQPRGWYWAASAAASASASATSAGAAAAGAGAGVAGASALRSARAAAGVAAVALLPGASRLHDRPGLGAARCLGRGAAYSTAPPPPPSAPATVASASQGNRWKKGVILLLKAIGLWLPAALFWASLVQGAPIIDLRTDEEIQDDETEVRRLERFFDVERLPEDQYFEEWTAKEQALSLIVDKLLKSRRFVTSLSRGAGADDVGGPDFEHQVSWSPSRKAAGGGGPEAGAAGHLACAELSYVLPPALAEEDMEAYSSGATRPWRPRLIVAHQSGAVALILLAFEYVVGGRDQEDRWACTALRADLVAGPDNELAGELLCDLTGPLPHGVRYMKI